jgi:hypothetical protein
MSRKDYFFKALSAKNQTVTRVTVCLDAWRYKQIQVGYGGSYGRSRPHDIFAVFPLD